MFDINKVKQDFPVLDQDVHEHRLVYLDSGASSQKPLQVINAVSDYYKHDHSNVHRGVHTLSQRATNLFEAARDKVQHFLNAPSNKEIIFVRGTTEGINLIAHSLGRHCLQAGDEILITEMEHHANIVPWQLMAEYTGAKVVAVAVKDNGELDLDDYKAKLNSKTKIVAVTHVSNAIGTVNDVKSIVALAKANGSYTVIDGSQAAPHQKIDVQDVDCDFYVITGHKMYAPTGIGAVFGKLDILNAIPPYHGGGEMIRIVTIEKSTYAEVPAKFEAGTPNIAGAIGLGAAIDYLNDLGIDNVHAYEQELLAYGLEKAANVPGLKMIGEAKDKAAILSFVIEGIHPHDLGTILDHQGVAVRTGHHCAQPIMKRFNVPATARASLGVYNTKEDLDALFDALTTAINMFK